MVMQFGEYVFPFPPSHIEVKAEELVTKIETIDGNTITTHMGTKPVQVICKGEFFGKTAMEQYLQLKAMCNQGAVKVLSIPKHPSFYAMCTGVNFLGNGGEQGVHYQVTFLEKGGNCSCQ